MTVRNLGDQPLSARAAAAQPGHICRGASLVDEDELLRIKPRLLALPIRAGGADVGAILLGCVQAFF